ncbi:MAG: hypothetical protein QME32_01520 [Endomicrobiia bacterium]|nr:hypothetical protein [Endomicrobiia bacterium]
MKRRNVTISILLLFYCFTVTVEQLAAASGARKHFLSHGPSVQAYGRGETATAFLNDMSGYFYNPALPAAIKRGSLSLSHYALFDGAMYNFFSLGQELSDKTIMGLSGINLRSGDIELREAIDSNPRAVNTSQWLMTGTLAADLRESLGILAGLNLNYLYFDFNGVTAGNIGLDAGVGRAFRGPFIFGNRSQVHLGIAGQSIIRPVMQLKSQKEAYPTTYRAGAAMVVPVFFRYNPSKQTFHYDKTSIYTDVIHDTDAGDARLAYGTEHSLLNRYTLRAGFNDTLTLGAGAKLGDYQFDYAIDFKSYAYFHRIGVVFYWGEAPEDEDEDFAHFMAVYTRVERLYAIQCKTARELSDKRNYESAVALLERSVYLLPSRRDAADLLKQARDLSAAGKIGTARDRALEQFQKGDYLSSYKTSVESLNISPEDADTKVLLERTYNEAAQRGLRVKQLKQDTVDALVALVRAAAASNDFEQAELNLAKLKTLDGESFVYYDMRKYIDEAKQKYVSSLVVKAEEEFNKKNYADSLIASERALAVDEKNSAARTSRKKAADGSDKKKKLSTKDRLYSERLYYTAAEHYAKNADSSAREVIFNLMRFNPAQEYVYPLYFRLTEKRIDADVKVKDADVDALRDEYEKTVVANRIKEFVLGAKIYRSRGDLVKAYQSYLSAYDLDPDDKAEPALGLKDIYEEVKPKKRTPAAAPRPGEWMEMSAEVYEQRGGYKSPERRPAEPGPELKEIEKIRADYVKSVRAAADILGAKGDYAVAEKELLKLKLFMSEGEINKMRRRLR